MPLMLVLKMLYGKYKMVAQVLSMQFRVHMMVLFIYLALEQCLVYRLT
jgi:hypothetical protein